MVITGQEIVERSFYQALLDSAIRRGLTFDPHPYEGDQDAYAAAREQFVKDKGFILDVFGNANPQSRNMKQLPRIVVNSLSYLPGTFGINKYHNEYVNGRWIVSETPYELTDQMLEVRLVAKTVQHIRLLNIILNESIPTRGYLKPYIYENAPFEGNIFSIFSNSYDDSDMEQGVLEKVYVYSVEDTLIAIPNEVWDDAPIVTIDVDIVDDKSKLGDIHVGLTSKRYFKSKGSYIVSKGSKMYWGGRSL